MKLPSRKMIDEALKEEIKEWAEEIYQSVKEDACEYNKNKKWWQSSKHYPTKEYILNEYESAIKNGFIRGCVWYQNFIVKQIKEKKK